MPARSTGLRKLFSLPNVRAGRRFSGGIVLPAQLRSRRVGRIESIDAGRRLRVPILCLDETDEIPSAQLVVGVGQTVRALELLGRSADGSFLTHAPAGGRVRAVGSFPTTSGSQRTCIEIDVLQETGALPGSPFRPPPPPASAEDWARLCDEFGLINFLSARPLSFSIRQARRRPIDHLIVRAMGAEPAENAAPAVLLEQGTLLIEAIERLGEALGAAHMSIAVSRRFRQGRRLLAHNTPGTRVRPVIMPDKYPQSAVPLLIQSVCGRVVPVGEIPEKHGVCVVDACTVAAFAQAIGCSLPLTHAVVTVTGDIVEAPRDYRIPAGMSVRELIARIEPARMPEVIVAGGPLTGRPIADPRTIIDFSTTCLTLLSAEAAPQRNPRACIRCGWCLDDCPVGLDPAALANLAEHSALDRAARLHPQACLECGICSYVCPSHIDLVGDIVRLKRACTSRQESRP